MDDLLGGNHPSGGAANGIDNLLGSSSNSLSNNPQRYDALAELDFAATSNT